MWEGRPIDSISGWPIFENGVDSSTGISMSSSTVMSCGNSPKLSSKESHTNSLQYPQHNERNRVFPISDELSDQVIIV
ncbi:unnamed protein product [Cercopithifilaria johnstoni]|uniref:Uncharacterized protein n=1 Tax=Cercopithifilaria johnstoni TaxID=2874296 RepID=A0A8J2M4G7_9BILA|nr:unnamed protein product [Cercopithifilaria johnstoni]